MDEEIDAVVSSSSLALSAEEYSSAIQPLIDEAMSAIAEKIDADVENMAGDSFLSSQILTRQVLAALTKTLPLTVSINREYDESFSVDGAKVGEVVNAIKTMRFAKDENSGLSIRMVQQFDPKDASLSPRLDVLYGFGTLRDEYSVRILDGYADEVPVLALDAPRMYGGDERVEGFPAIVVPKRSARPVSREGEWVTVEVFEMNGFKPGWLRGRYGYSATREAYYVPYRDILELGLGRPIAPMIIQTELTRAYLSE